MPHRRDAFCVQCQAYGYPRPTGSPARKSPPQAAKPKARLRALHARVIRFTGDARTSSYAGHGTVLYQSGTDNFPENGRVAVTGSGAVFFDLSYTSAVVYQLAGGA